MSKQCLEKYRTFLLDIGYCQVCGSSDLEIPHHVGIGIKRDDRYQVQLCVGCHRKIHNTLFTWHITPDTKELNYIGKENYQNFKEYDEN